MSTTGIDEAKLEQFMGQAVTDMGAAMSAPLIVLGLKLGLYKAMAGAGPLTSVEVSERAGCDERHVREWLGNQVIGGYIPPDPHSDTHQPPPQPAPALAGEAKPRFLPRAVDIIAACLGD